MNPTHALVVLSPLWPALRFRLFLGNFSGWSIEGVDVNSTPSIRHLEEILFEKVESPGQAKVTVGVWLLQPC
jgi:hypothetical protein